MHPVVNLWQQIDKHLSYTVGATVCHPFTFLGLINCVIAKAANILRAIFLVYTPRYVLSVYLDSALRKRHFEVWSRKMYQLPCTIVLWPLQLQMFLWRKLFSNVQAQPPCRRASGVVSIAGLAMAHATPFLKTKIRFADSAQGFLKCVQTTRAAHATSLSRLIRISGYHRSSDFYARRHRLWQV